MSGRVSRAVVTDPILSASPEHAIVSSPLHSSSQHSLPSPHPIISSTQRGGLPSDHLVTNLWHDPRALLTAPYAAHPYARCHKLSPSLSDAGIPWFSVRPLGYSMRGAKPWVRYKPFGWSGVISSIKKCPQLVRDKGDGATPPTTLLQLLIPPTSYRPFSLSFATGKNGNHSM